LLFPTSVATNKTPPRSSRISVSKEEVKKKTKSERERTRDSRGEILQRERERTKTMKTTLTALIPGARNIFVIFLCPCHFERKLDLTFLRRVFCAEKVRERKK
jgi:hypothetical protein